MKNKLLIPFMIGILGQSCQNISDQTKKTIKDTLIQKQSVEQKIPNIVYDISLSYEQQKIIEDVVKGYFSQYPCSMKELTISSDVVEDKKNETTLAHAKPHYIYLNTEDITDNTSLKNTIIHELFHTIKTDSLTITSPYTLKDGYTIIGYHGLSVVVKNDQQQTQFGLFEDAAAEALAALYDQNYKVPNVYYSNIGSLMLKLIKRGFVTTDVLVQFQSNNDMGSFCDMLLNKKTTPQDVESLMQLFNEVYMTDQDITEQAIKNIEKLKIH